MYSSFLISLLFSLNLLNLNNYLEYQFYVEIPNTEFSNIILFKYGDEIYTISPNIEVKDNSCFKFNVFNKDTNYTLNVNANNNTDYLKVRGSTLIHNFALNDKYLVILTDYNIFIFKKDPNDNFIFQNRIPLENNQSLKNIFLEKDYLVLINNRTYSSLDTRKNNIYVGKVNLQEKPYNLKIDYLYNIKYLELSRFQPKDLVSYDIENDRCFIAEAMDYKIKIFKNGVLQDSIYRKINSWNDSISTVIKQKLDRIPKYDTMTYQTGMTINNIMNSVTKDYYASSKIREIIFLKPDKLLVIWEGPEIKESLNLHFDLWENGLGKWSLIKQDVRTPDIDTNKSVLQNSFLQCGMFKIFDDGSLVGIEYGGINMFDNEYKNMKLSDYWNAYGKKIEESELGVALYIYKLNFEKKDE